MTPQPALEPGHDPGFNPAPKAAPFLPPGARPDYYRDPRSKSPVLATVLSLMPGLGQVYLGYTQLGFIHTATFAAFVALMNSNQLGRLEPFVGISMAFFFLYNLVDAHRRALLLNESLAQLESPALPDGFGTVSFGARLAAGVGLILVGLLTLLNLRFGLSLAWLEHWWPLGLVLLGIYLVVRAVKDHAATQPDTQD
jgi:hypothetical protein